VRGWCSKANRAGYVITRVTLTRPTPRKRAGEFAAHPSSLFNHYSRIFFRRFKSSPRSAIFPYRILRSSVCSRLWG